MRIWRHKCRSNSDRDYNDGDMEYDVPIYTLQATNVAAALQADGRGPRGYEMFDDGRVSFYGSSGWLSCPQLTHTVASARAGQIAHASFLTWFSTNSFGGTNYSNTTVGGITYVVRLLIILHYLLRERDFLFVKRFIFSDLNR